MRQLLILIIISHLNLNNFAQTNQNLPTVEKYITPFSGIFVGGYVDNGAFINFTGPNLNFTKGKSQFLVGMLPSLRIKRDTGATTNSLITPTLGFGITYCYRAFAFQIPCYYNTKSATKNGAWNIGVGIGIKLNALKFEVKKS
jgi:hypothetical protein